MRVVVQSDNMGFYSVGVDKDDILQDFNHAISIMYMGDYEIRYRPLGGLVDPTKTLEWNGFEDGSTVYAHAVKTEKNPLLAPESSPLPSSPPRTTTKVISGKTTIRSLKEQNSRKFGVKFADQKIFIGGNEMSDEYIFRPSDVNSKIFVCVCGGVKCCHSSTL